MKAKGVSFLIIFNYNECYYKLMSSSKNISEERRQEIKQRINHILEPLIVDILIVKPENHIAFMRQWLEARREYFKTY